MLKCLVQIRLKAVQVSHKSFSGGLSGVGVEKSRQELQKIEGKKCIHTYIYVYIYVCYTCICIYTYIHIYINVHV